MSRKQIYLLVGVLALVLAAWWWWRKRNNAAVALPLAGTGYSSAKMSMVDPGALAARFFQ